MKEIHEYATWFPRPNKHEYTALKADIKKKGLLNPITLYQNKILDGLSRHRACEELGIEPEYTVYEGEDPLGYAISQNLYRRHLDAAQKAAIGAELADKYRDDAMARRVATLKQGDKSPVSDHGRYREQGKADLSDYSRYGSSDNDEFPVSDYSRYREQGKAVETAAEEMTAMGQPISSRSIERARQIRESDPDIFEKMKSGQIKSIKVASEYAKRNGDNNNQHTNGTIDYKKGGFFYGRFQGNNAEKRGKPFTDNSDQELEAWLGCPECGVYIKMEHCEDQDNAIQITIEATKGGRDWQTTTEILEKYTVELDGKYNIKGL